MNINTGVLFFLFTGTFNLIKGNRSEVLEKEGVFFFFLQKQKCEIFQGKCLFVTFCFHFCSVLTNSRKAGLRAGDPHHLSAADQAEV